MNPCSPLRRFRRSLGVLLATTTVLFATAAQARSAVDNPALTRPAPQPTVDLVLALDVSSSMSGLINSAKQRLWDVVNEVGQASPTPRLRVALITYGHSSYDAQRGWVKISQPFTSNLDQLNQTLFALTTNGGDEYVARAVATAINELQWSGTPNASRVLFVAGNESAAQDPQISLDQLAEMAASHNVAINAIFCGTPQHNDAPSWAQVAELTGGMYAWVDQNAAAVAQVQTPMDAEITALNNELNKTYMPFGDDGAKAAEVQVKQDQNAASMSQPAATSRAVTKASGLYDNRSWDLVDAVAAGRKLEEMEADALPEPLRGMSPEEQRAVVQQAAAKRQELKEKIGALGRDRSDYLRAQVADDDKALDTALKKGLQKAVEAQGIKLPTAAETTAGG